MILRECRMRVLLSKNNLDKGFSWREAPRLLVGLVALVLTGAYAFFAFLLVAAVVMN